VFHIQEGRQMPEGQSLAMPVRKVRQKSHPNNQPNCPIQAGNSAILRNFGRMG
jgi:hypothetical protein